MSVISFMPGTTCLIRRLVSPLSVVIKRFQRARLRRVMRGYRALKRSGDLARISAVREAISEQSLGLAREMFSPVVMGCAVDSGEILVREYLLIRVGGINLNRALLHAHGRERGQVVFPLPRVWRDILVRHGFAVAHIRSSLLWHCYTGILLFYGMAVMGKTALTCLLSRNGAHGKNRKHVFFADIGPGNLPQESDGRHSYDVVSWYLQWPGRMPGIEAVYHSVPGSLPIATANTEVLPRRGPLPSLTGVKPIMEYAAWGLVAIAISVIDMLRGRWWHALLLNQAAMMAQARLLPEDALAREYLFHNSGWIYRPLWTYEAERRGAAITLYFYSTNCESFKKAACYPPISYGYKAMNWSRYLVWDEYQKDFVRRAVGERANPIVVGPIWFQSSAASMPAVDRPGVAVFDITPHRASRYCTLGMDGEFYTPLVANPFLQQVSDVIQDRGLLMLWKRKRNIGRVAHPFYRGLANRLADSSHIVLVDTDISAMRVIESSLAVISMPYTSTALIARDMGKPSVYYDPSGLLQRDDRAAHGIPILSGVDELKSWLTDQVSPQPGLFNGLTPRHSCNSGNPSCSADCFENNQVNALYSRFRGNGGPR
jgi:polysaccharide biosynthesis PFTS motif protein